MPQPPSPRTDRPIIDVRTRSEFDHERVPCSVHRGLLRALIGPRLPPDALVVCHSGPRAALVAALRGGSAYRGGIVAWRRNGGPLERSTTPRWSVLLMGIAVAAVSVAAVHVVEDLRNGVAAGVPRPLAAVALVAVLGTELVAAVLAALGGRRPGVLLVVTGGVWVIAAASDHADDLAATHFRTGLPSQALIVALIGLQVAVAVGGASAAMRRPPTRRE